MNLAVNSSVLPSTDPVVLYRLREGIYATDLLIVAITELDLFTWIHENTRVRVEEIERHLRLDARALDVMITYLVALGLLARASDNEVQLTALSSEHLVAGSAWDLRGYFASMSERPGCTEMLAALRTGATASWASATDSRNWADRLEDTDWARRVVAAMDSRGQFLGPALAAALDQLAGISRVLDIGGDSGVYSCSLVDHRPEVRAAVFERPPVDDIARRLITERGYADRVEVITGDMFVDLLPEGYDAHIYSHVLHDWNESQVRGLFAASYSALEPGGWVIDHDAHINADKTGPLPVAEYSVMMMHSTPGKCWSVSELDTMLTGAGFVDVRYISTISDRSIVAARKPRG